jgi:hypothetical protein
MFGARFEGRGILAQCLAMAKPWAEARGLVGKLRGLQHPYGECAEARGNI